MKAQSALSQILVAYPVSAENVSGLGYGEVVLPDPLVLPRETDVVILPVTP